ncbi:MAG: aromatic ring-hydroxylating dioxygenase subunit alpha, partial [Dongiaceae bacterium]
MSSLCERGLSTAMFDPNTYANIRRPLLDAETLPNWCYNSDEFYRLEVDRIFGKVWNFFGRAESIPNPGDYRTVNFVGTPIIIVRANDGSLKAFANTCRHRGARIATGDGKCRHFVCPYHGWVYNLDGSLKACAGMEKTHNFDKAEYGLIPIRLESWGGFVFLNFDNDAEPLCDYLGDLPEQMESYNCTDLVLTCKQEYELNCNWKLHIENAVEQYHVPMVHRTTLQKKKCEYVETRTRGN